MPATVPLPIQRLRPSSTHSSPSRRAVVSRATTSEPWFGSVSAKAPSTSQAAIRGRYLARCSADPSIPMVVMASPECTAFNVLMLPSPRASSAAIMPSASGESPGQPSPTDRPAGNAERRVARHQIEGEFRAFPVTGRDRGDLGVAPDPDPIPEPPFRVGEQVVEPVEIGGPRQRQVVAVR